MDQNTPYAWHGIALAAVLISGAATFATGSQLQGSLHSHDTYVYSSDDFDVEYDDYEEHDEEQYHDAPHDEWEEEWDEEPWDEEWEDEDKWHDEESWNEHPDESWEEDEWHEEWEDEEPWDDEYHGEDDWHEGGSWKEGGWENEGHWEEEWDEKPWDEEEYHDAPYHDHEWEDDKWHDDKDEWHDHKDKWEDHKEDWKEHREDWKADHEMDGEHMKHKIDEALSHLRKALEYAQERMGDDYAEWKHSEEGKDVMHVMEYLEDALHGGDTSAVPYKLGRVRELVQRLMGHGGPHDKWNRDSIPDFKHKKQMHDDHEGGMKPPMKDAMYGVEEALHRLYRVQEDGASDEDIDYLIERFEALKDKMHDGDVSEEDMKQMKELVKEVQPVIERVMGEFHRQKQDARVKEEIAHIVERATRHFEEMRGRTEHGPVHDIIEDALSWLREVENDYLKEGGEEPHKDDLKRVHKHLEEIIHKLQGVHKEHKGNHEGDHYDKAGDRIHNVVGEMDEIFGEIKMFYEALDAAGVTLDPLAVDALASAENAFDHVKERQCDGNQDFDKSTVKGCKVAIMAVLRHLETAKSLVMAQAEEDDALMEVINSMFGHEEDDMDHGAPPEHDEYYEDYYEDDYYPHDEDADGHYDSDYEYEDYDYDADGHYDDAGVEYEYEIDDDHYYEPDIINVEPDAVDVEQIGY